VDSVWLEPVRSAASARDGILQVFGNLARDLDASGSVRGCPVNNLTLELAFADADYRAALRALFDRWRDTLAGRLAEASVADPEALATTIIAAYSGAMAIAKVEQSGEPLRHCAMGIMPLLDH
jgi:hypothetical protein